MSDTVTVFSFLRKHLDEEEGLALDLVRESAYKEIPGLPFKATDPQTYLLDCMFATAEGAIEVEESGKPASVPQVVHELLIRTFDWAVTPQGTMFWAAVSDKYRVRAGLKRQFYIN